ncbi:MAG: Ig-like domain-containing protein [Vicinamibacterales bacterium]|nr:Ig-like domain-containing protein [Vicinamibacterales bacterium]
MGIVVVWLGGAACAPAPAADLAASVPERGVVTIAVVPEGTPPGELRVASVSQPVHGLAQTGAPGTVVYTPATRYRGEDRFTYTLEDRAGRLVIGTITVTVLPVNDPPEPRHDLFTLTWQEALDAARLDVLWNDSDANLDALRIVGVTDGARGSVSIIEDGAAVVYRAHERFRDVDAFEYTVSDGEHEVTTWVVVQVTIPGETGPPRRPASRTGAAATPPAGR